MKTKSFNSGYNIDYNTGDWVEELLEKLDRTKAEVTFDLHLFDRLDYHNLKLDEVEETVRTGTVVRGKCQEPNKVCFKRYFGKENITYTVIAKFHGHFVEVKTAWSREGR